MTIAPDRLPLLIALAAAGILAAALGSEYLFDLQPCELCYWQRWPHVIAVVLGLAAMAVPAGPPRALAASVLGLVLLGGAGIAAYHMGVEYGWWLGPETCTGPPLTETDPAALFDALMATQPIRCDEVQFRFLGLSIAAWNLAASLALAGAAAAAARGLFRRAPQGGTRWARREGV